MEKRIILNIMIIAILAFYMVFNIVYQRLINKHDSEPEEELQTQEEVWQQPFLVPENWHLIRLEMGDLMIRLDAQDNWISSDDSTQLATIEIIANSWQKLAANDISTYQQLPLEGKTILVFVEEDSQPLIFRVIEYNNEIQFYRMIDQKKFSYPANLKGQFLL